MIKSKTVKLKVSSTTKQHYSNLGYDLSQKEIDLKIEDLKPSSMQRIDVICDTCECCCNIQYAKYNQNIQNNGLFSCKKCYDKKLHERFTSNNPSLDPECIIKKRETSMRNYGVDHPTKSEKIQNKISKNVKFSLQSPAIKKKKINTLVRIYGVDNASKIDFVKDKKIQTSLLHYGVEHHMQLKEFFEKFMKSSFKLKKYKETNLYYQASYEFDFLNYCDDFGIIDDITNGPSVKYVLESNETNHIYHPDFFIGKLNLMIEVKSNYTYKVDLDKNLMKEKYCLLEGYNFLFVIDKDYSILNEYIRKIRI